MNELLSRISVLALKESRCKVFEGIKHHLSAVQRLERAYDMLTLSTEYRITLGKDGIYTVQSPHDTYTVQADGTDCSCPDSEKGFVCKHRFAIRLLLVASSASAVPSP